MDNMVLVEKGTFKMGNTRGDSKWNDETPVHKVTLTYDYWVGKYQVTFDEYDKYSNSVGESFVSDEGWGREQSPVINVSWKDAINYCNWLSEKKGYAKAYDSEGNLLDEHVKKTTEIKKVEGYRLPTESEWEYAARGGQKATRDWKYSGSCLLEDVGWYLQNSGDKILTETDINRDWDCDKITANHGKTHPVGLKQPNELGLYDMSGNVWEWCHDSYLDYTYTDELRTDPTGSKNYPNRGVRGGCWSNYAQYCRITNSDYNDLRNSNKYLGFRVVRIVSQEDLNEIQS